MFSSVPPRIQPIDAIWPEKVKRSLSFCACLSVFALSITNKLRPLICKTPRRAKIAMPYPLRLISVLMSGALFLMGQGNYSYGTAIAIIRTNDAISIAADSRAVNSSGDQLPDSCKILGAGESFFSLHGVGSSAILGSIKAVLIQRGSIFEKARIVRAKLQPMIAAGRAERSTSSGVFLLGADNGQLQLADVEFFGPGMLAPWIQECPGVACPSGIALIAAAAYQTKLGPDARTIDDARSFVLDEIAKGKALEERTGKAAVVGGPLQSLVIQPSGKHEWHDKPEFCKDQP